SGRRPADLRRDAGDRRGAQRPGEQPARRRDAADPDPLSTWRRRGPAAPSYDGPGGEPILISDPEDPRIADYRALTDLELRSRWEPPNGLFIAEGELVLRRARRGGARVRSALGGEKGRPPGGGAGA